MNAKLRTSILAAAIAALPLGVQAAGLGNIHVKSGLGQPLNAEIEVSAAPAEARQLSARIADMDAFQRANIPYSLLMTEISTSVEQRGKRTYIKLTSQQPVNEPIVDMVIALDWQEGSATREYTFLLDPVEGVSAPAKSGAPLVTPPTPTVAAEYSGPRMPQETIRETRISADAAPSIAQPAPAAAAPTPAQPASAPVARDEDAPAAAPVAAGGDEYRVVRGDTLSAIARRQLGGSGNLDQMLIALLRANPDAFIDGNVNRLRAGAILRMPDADAIEAVDRSEARRQVRAQAADFNSYRNRLAGIADQTTVADSGEGARSSTGTISAPVAPADQSATGDRVVVSGGTQVADAGKDARINALQEELASKEAALKESNERVAELESMVEDLKKLTALPAQAPAAAPAEPSAPPAIDVQQPEPAAPAEVAPVETQPPAAAEPPAAEQPAAEPPAAEQAPAAEEPEPAPVEETPPQFDSESAPPVEEYTPPAEEQPAEAPTPVSEPSTPPAEESSSSLPLIGGGLLALLALIYGISRIRRARQQAEEDEFIDDESGFVDDMSEQPVDEEEDEDDEPASQFGDAGGRSVDTAADDVQTDFVLTNEGEESDVGVDPIAEADVYLGYGRAEAAVGILQDAIKANSTRPDLYVKLLECYSQLQDVDQFGLTATELYTLTNGKGAEWNKAAELGRELDPENPLYQSGGAAPVAQAAAAPAAAPAASNADDVPLTFDLDIGDDPVSSAPASPAHDANLERTIVASEETAAPEAAAPAGETLDFNLDKEGDAENAGELSFDSLDLTDDKIGLNEGATLSNEPDEVDTKLDLARAYDEMGDKEGARELIEEVIREGNPQQQEKARQLQAQLDS